MKPPMPYSGGKQTIAEQIVDMLPPHSHYVEPFCGAMSVLLAKTPSKIETVNDISGDLVAFWRVLRDRPAELERVCALTPHSREEFVASHERDGLDDLELPRRDPLRRPVRARVRIPGRPRTTPRRPPGDPGRRRAVRVRPPALRRGTDRSATNMNGARRTEVVWTNYEPHPTLLTSEATA